MARVTKDSWIKSLLLLSRLGLFDLGGNKDAVFTIALKLASHSSEDICLADLLVERLSYIIVLEQDDAGGFLAFLAFACDLQCGLAFLGFLERAFRALQGALDGAFGIGVAFLLFVIRGVDYSNAEGECGHREQCG